jgi:hypothetical protein
MNALALGIWGDYEFRINIKSIGVCVYLYVYYPDCHKRNISA